ncbi:MAG TPA: hypothetical protein VFC95_01175, partial [Guyparkeria sp.]|nr:hypothetical protein [Guyparkeria sp.]
MIQSLRQRLAGQRRLVGLLCLVVALQSLWCCTWHAHTNSGEANAGTVHLGHGELHADAVELEPTATLSAFSDGLGLIMALALLIILPRPATRRAPLTVAAPCLPRLRLRPP